uniref:Tail protein n=1 Tax=Salmonella phage vB_SEnST11_KE23 TaxID=3161174 RepID=A0AAU8GG06_9CAUD
MYEDLLGRPASNAETKMLDRGFIPPFKFGEKVGLVTVKNAVATITGVVLFAIPPSPVNPHPGLTWGFLLDRHPEYLPGEALKCLQPE